MDLTIILKDVIIQYNNPEWEFPKGKRLLNENNKTCAIRELKEETNIVSSDFIILKNVVPFSETIKGENDIVYKNIYYIGQCNYKNNIKIDDNNKNQKYEINNVLFLTKENALKKIRPYNNSKLKIINNIFNFLDNNLNNYIIK